MNIIPVLDIKTGTVVRACRGQRDAYPPLRSALCQDSDPRAVVDALLSIFPFPAIYIADLDAITGRGNNTALIAALAGSFPEMCFWLDAGFARPAELLALGNRGGLTPVLGSESQLSIDTFRALREQAPRSVLSLDFRGDRFLGPEALLRRVESWPQQVIVMELDRVGTGSGPGLDRLAGLAAAAPDRRFYAAGGVRGRGDLAALAAAGAAGVLLASALHDRLLTRDDIVACTASQGASL